MLGKIPRLVWLIVALTVVIPATMACWPDISRGEICEKNEYTKAKECTYYKRLSFIFIKIVKTLDHHEGSVMGFVTLALAFFTWKLWWTTDRLVKGADKTAERQLRAYVALDDIYFTWMGMPAESTKTFPDGDSFVKVRVQNYGQTPAHDMEIWADFTKLAESEHKYTYSTELPEIGRQMLHPRQSYAAAIMRENQIEKHLHATFIYGRIIYQDIYRKKWWVTRFCYHYQGQNKFVPTGRHNHESRYDTYEEAKANYKAVSS